MLTTPAQADSLWNGQLEVQLQLQLQMGVMSLSWQCASAQRQKKPAHLINIMQIVFP
jgi:hypothetical protein